MKQCPIPKQLFPSHISENSSLRSSRESFRNETKIRSVLDKFDYIINTADESEDSYLLLYDYLIDIHDILIQNTNFFSFSPTLVNYAIKKFDDFLNSLYSPENYKYVYGSIKSTCYVLILMIKMRFHIMIHQMFHFLSLLIQLLNLQEENPEIKNDPFLLSLEDSRIN